MQVFSHSKDGLNGERIGSKLLIDHLQGVRDKAIKKLSERVSFHDADRTSELVDAICWLHDLGKYTAYFQTYLLNPTKADYHLKGHSNIGAHTAHEVFKDDPIIALLLFFIIKMHHSNLRNIDQVLYPSNSQYAMEEPDIFEKQFRSLTELSEFWNKFPKAKAECIKLSSPAGLIGAYKTHLKKSPLISHYFQVNYLFSLLIESDKLDASDTLPFASKSLNPNAVDERVGFGKPNYPHENLDTLNQNELRNFVRASIVQNMEREDILSRRIFTLAAPTGIGKTMSSLDFVLKLRNKIHIEEGYLPQIIYGLPYINIIEQSLDEYEKTIGPESVMAHYQYADIFGKDELDASSVNDHEALYNQQKMAWDTWQKDVVITSFVQLFETLIGNRNKLLKKFNHFADSILILDEVQTLALEKLPVIGAALYYACKHLNTRVLIMTATQPQLFQLMVRELKVDIESEALTPLNLLERDKEVFACFNRTTIVPIIEEKIETEDFIDIMNKYWVPTKSCLIVVNKVNRSVDLFYAVSEMKSTNNFSNPILYLSTNITPRDRRRTINWLKYKMKQGHKPIVISTQVIEAGVDLDFDMGFRDLGPIDSIVQVAGRINRENSKSRQGSPLYILDFGDCQQIYGHATNVKAREALNKKAISENEYKEMVERYFEVISDRTMADFSYSIEIFEAMKALRYGNLEDSRRPLKTVSDFKIIEESRHGISIYVELPTDPKASKARNAFQKLLRGDMNKSEFDRNHKRDFNQRIIAAPNYLENVSKLKQGGELAEGILWIKPEDAEYYYSTETGFKRKGIEQIYAISY